MKLVKNLFFNEKETRKKLAEFILKNEPLTMGKYCKKFEDDFSKFLGRKYSVSVNSGSSANLILIQSLLNLEVFQKGDKIIVSGLTWATNIMPLLQLGLVPILCDIDVFTLNIDLNELEKLISKYKPKALFLTNALGFSCDLFELNKICSKNGIMILEDNCESLGGVYCDGKSSIKLGNAGLASTHAFYASHQLCTIEGGMVSTDSKELYEMLVMTRAHGWRRNLPDYSNDFNEQYQFFDLAYNVRPTEITGFLGCEQLKYLSNITGIKYYVYESIKKEIEDIPDFIIPNISNMVSSPLGFPIIFVTKQKRDFYYKKFKDAGIETRPIIAGDMLKQPFIQKYGVICDKNINCEFVAENGFYFGLPHDITAKEIEKIMNILLTNCK